MWRGPRHSTICATNNNAPWVLVGCAKRNLAILARSSLQQAETHLESSHSIVGQTCAPTPERSEPSQDHVVHQKIPAKTDYKNRRHHRGKSACDSAQTTERGDR